MALSRPLTHELRFARLASGTRIAWARSGRADAPVLVRPAHWLTQVEADLTSPLWAPWLERMGRHFQLVRYDERGCGLSDADDAPLNLEAAVEELSAVIDACGAPRVALLGISGSGAPAIAYAARHPARVSHLVLHGAYARGLLCQAAPAEALQYFEATLRLVELGWGRRDPGVQQLFTTRFAPEATPEQAAALNEQQRLCCDGRRAAAIARARAGFDVSALLPALRVPTLVTHADGDLTVPLAAGRELAAAIPGARFEVLRSRNHVPLVGDGCFERFFTALTEFIGEGRGTASGPALTPAEAALARLVGEGLDNAQIAARLGLADKTVRNRLSTLYAKLGVEGRPQAVVRARDLSL